VSCKTGKVRHQTREAAVAALRNIKNAGLKSYKCPHCKGWHLANDRRDWKLQARIDQLLGRR